MYYVFFILKISLKSKPDQNDNSFFQKFISIQTSLNLRQLPSPANMNVKVLVILSDVRWCEDVTTQQRRLSRRRKCLNKFVILMRQLNKCVKMFQLQR